ncbi:MAG: hypothetical protein JNM99_20035 [Verrucomicrobiaceae bacterium]|nr:hypothetical protein [Verrucomicrobiaceae bacterium]
MSNTAPPTQPEQALENELVAQLGGLGVAEVVVADEAEQAWKKGLL